jgi:hypothetical protein
MFSTTSRPRRGRLLIMAAIAMVAAGLGGSSIVAAQTTDTTHVAQNGGPGGLTSAQRTVLRQATRQFRDVDAAIAAGYVPTQDCVPEMGLHYVNFALATDSNIDPTLPEVLVYQPQSDGSVRLGALEFFRLDADQDLATDEDRPTLFGHPFDGPMEPHPGMPANFKHYDLHVWLYKTNPTGELNPDNPNVDCNVM